MIGRTDPLAKPETLIPRVYSYVSYRIGHGPEAEDVVSATFERAVRYRHTYDRQRGAPITWLIAIAKHCLNDAIAARRDEVDVDEIAEPASEFVLEDTSLGRIELRAAIERLGERDQELLALRYGADLRAGEIAALVGAKANAVEVALHRARGRLRLELETPDAALSDLDQAAAL